MDDDPNSGARSAFVGVNYAKLKYPSIGKSFPDEFYPHVGLIALSWGRYEQIFNRLLAALVDFTGDASEPNWQFLDYKRRRSYCRKLVVTTFRTRNKLREYILRTLDDSADAHNDRNLIVHGITYCEVDNRDPQKPLGVHLLAEGRVARKKVVRRFSVDALETLAYEIMHIAGRINVSPDSFVRQLSSSDTRVLAELLSRIPPQDSILPTLPAPL